MVIESNPADRRAKNVRLSEQELNHFREMKRHRRQMEELLLNGFTEAERTQLLAYLKRIVGNLDGNTGDGTDGNTDGKQTENEQIRSI